MTPRKYEQDPNAGGAAFPTMGSLRRIGDRSSRTPRQSRNPGSGLLVFPGIDLFLVKRLAAEYVKQRFVQWPAAWADEMLKARAVA